MTECVYIKLLFKKENGWEDDLRNESRVLKYKSTYTHSEDGSFD